MSIEVSTAEELRDAINNGEEDIFIINRQLAKRINTIRKIKKMGPVALGAAIGAIPVIVLTGPAGFMIGFWSGSASGVFAIAGLIVAIGGTIAISLFTDWDYVELPMGIKMTRRNAAK